MTSGFSRLIAVDHVYLVGYKFNLKHLQILRTTGSRWVCQSARAYMHACMDVCMYGVIRALNQLPTYISPPRPVIDLGGFAFESVGHFYLVDYKFNIFRFCAVNGVCV